MRLIYFGTPEFSADILKGLLDDPFFDVVGLVTRADEPQGRKRVLTAPPTKQLFQKTHPNRPVFQPTKLKDPALEETIRALKPDAFVVVVYGRIIPANLLDIPPLGSINLHPSILPRWRGPSPMQAALLAGDKETGISIMKIDEEMDHGPVLSLKKLSLDVTETTPSLTQKVVDHGRPFLIETLKEYAANEIEPQTQSEEDVTYCPLLKREDGRTAFHEPADLIERKIRAYTPWPGVTATLTLPNGEAVETKILSAKISNKKYPSGKIAIEDRQLLVGTETNALEITSLQPATKKPMSGSDFIRGYLSASSPQSNAPAAAADLSPAP